jgi:hypothetical protein
MRVFIVEGTDKIWWERSGSPGEQLAQRLGSSRGDIDDTRGALAHLARRYGDETAADFLSVSTSSCQCNQ